MPATLKSRLDATETTPMKRGGFPRLPGPLKSRLDAPRGRRNDSGEARRVSAVAGNSQKPSRRPLGPPKRLRRSEKGFRGCRQLSKVASTPPGATETTSEKRGGFPWLPATLKSRLYAPGEAETALKKQEGFPAVASTTQKQPHPPRLREGVFPSPPFCQLSPQVILADHHTYRNVKEVNALKAVVGREVI